MENNETKLNALGEAIKALNLPFDPEKDIEKNPPRADYRACKDIHQEAEDQYWKDLPFDEVSIGAP